METRYLNTLVASVEAGTFSKAAELLHITQSAVSQRIKFLEEHFGQQLLDRSGQRLALTLSGKIVFDKAKDKEAIALNQDNKIYNARYNWEPVCMTYKASGKEEYLTIGNFYNNKETKYEKLKKLTNFRGTQIPTAYYYLDQVEVFIMEDPAECACNQVQNEAVESVVYHKESASEDGFTIEEQLKLATVYFDIKKSKLESNMQKDIDVLAGSLKANPEYKIVLHGH